MADLPYIAAYAHGGYFAVGQPHLIVIHSTEGPMSRGNAKALAGASWFGGPRAGTSAHDIYDPSGGVRMLSDDTVAWHCGPGGNGKGTGSEHCGRVSMTRAQWLSADGQSMLDASARENTARAKRLGIPPRWLSLTQLRAGAAGFCTHNDIRLVFGGTTHSDPGPNFPYDWYIARVQHYYNGGMAAITAPAKPAAPKPKGLTMDAEVKAAFDALNAKIDAQGVQQAQQNSSVVMRLNQLVDKVNRTGQAEADRYTDEQGDLGRIEQAVTTKTPEV